jgi:hypothetical protein
VSRFSCYRRRSLRHWPSELISPSILPCARPCRRTRLCGAAKRCRSLIRWARNPVLALWHDLSAALSSTMEIAERAVKAPDAVPRAPTPALLARALGRCRALRRCPCGRDGCRRVALGESAKLHGVDMAPTACIRHASDGLFSALSSRAE